ncbi:hypothetical protein Tco_0680623 [Tanacetum coccineum]|uniref:Uncharacterized protein n=1 Tax=Tanacetum coccineum TaxID=301880 RepID=A0ABQ4XLC9_9ASTR
MHRYSNPMIQPELEGSTQGYPLVSVEVHRYDTKGEKVRIRNNADRDGANSGTNPIRVILRFSMMMEIMLGANMFIMLLGEHAVLMNLDTYVLERFDTSAGNPVKEILLKLNLPDHRSILTDSKVTPTNHMRITKPYSSPRFIANCFNAGYLKMEVKVPDSAGLNKIQ